jgi:hypothetical protein
MGTMETVILPCVPVIKMKGNPVSVFDMLGTCKGLKTH